MIILTRILYFSLYLLGQNVFSVGEDKQSGQANESSAQENPDQFLYLRVVEEVSGKPYEELTLDELGEHAPQIYKRLLFEAIAKNSLHFARMALGSEDLNINARDEASERTALHLAAIYNRAKIAQALLQRNIDIEAQDSEGNTALHLAVENNSFGVGILILSKKPNCIFKRKDGLTPLQLAFLGNPGELALAVIQKTLMHHDNLQDSLLSLLEDGYRERAPRAFISALESIKRFVKGSLIHGSIYYNEENQVMALYAVQIVKSRIESWDTKISSLSLKRDLRKKIAAELEGIKKKLPIWERELKIKCQHLQPAQARPAALLPASKVARSAQKTPPREQQRAPARTRTRRESSEHDEEAGHRQEHRNSFAAASANAAVSSASSLVASAAASSASASAYRSESPQESMRSQSRRLAAHVLAEQERKDAARRLRYLNERDHALLAQPASALSSAAARPISRQRYATPEVQRSGTPQLRSVSVVGDEKTFAVYKEVLFPHPGLMEQFRDITRDLQNFGVHAAGGGKKLKDLKHNGLDVYEYRINEEFRAYFTYDNGVLTLIWNPKHL